MCSHTKSSPKCRRRKGALNTTQETQLPLCLAKGANHHSRPAIWPLLPFQPHCLLLLTRFRCSSKMDSLTSHWKHFKLFCRLFPSDHPIAPDSILRNPCHSSTLSSNAMSFKKFSLITSINSEIYVSEKHYVNYNMQCKCWLLVYQHFAYPTIHRPISSWTVIGVQILIRPQPHTISQRPGPLSLKSM